MKIVIPVLRNRVSPVFDWSRNLLLIDIQSGREMSRQEIAIAEPNQGKQVCKLVELGANLLVCSGISKELMSLIKARSIGVISGVSGDIDDVLRAICMKKLSHPRFMMPGCAGRRGQNRLRSGFDSRCCEHVRNRR